MKQLVLLFTIPFLFFHVKAEEPPNSHVISPLHSSLAVIIGFLPIMLSFTIFVIVYAKFCHRTESDLFNHSLHHQNLHGLIGTRSRFSGIDRTLIDSLPFFRFSSLKGSKEGLECAVCLSKFEDSEVLRLLPKCKHVFHMNCIDHWLESHSSCPLCRNKFDAGDLSSFTYSNSLRFPRNPSNLSDDPNLELFVEREEDHQGSSRLTIENSFRKIEMGKKEELLIQQGSRSAGDRKLLHKFKHKIIISNVVFKNRWSDVNSSDLVFLNSEMLNVMSSKRFSPADSKSGNVHNAFSMNEQILQVKQDIERNRLYESKFSKLNRSHSVSASSSPSTSNHEATPSRFLNSAEKRSMSEITNLSRFTEFGIKNKFKELSNNGKDGKEERMRRLWLPIARRTVQWFAGRERSSQEQESKGHPSNV